MYTSLIYDSTSTTLCFYLWSGKKSKAWLTTGEDEVGGTQQNVGEGLQEAEVHQVGEEPDSHHQHWEAFKEIETCKHTCWELHTQVKGNSSVVKEQLVIITDFYNKRQIYSPVSCILLFDWWLLCILLLVLPSSTGQQLGNKGSAQENNTNHR